MFNKVFPGLQHGGMAAVCSAQVSFSRDQVVCTSELVPYLSSPSCQRVIPVRLSKKSGLARADFVVEDDRKSECFIIFSRLTGLVLRRHLKYLHNCDFLFCID